MEQQWTMQDHYRSTTHQKAREAQSPRLASNGLKLPNVTERLQTDEQALSEWCAKIAELRKQSTP